MTALHTVDVVLVPDPRGFSEMPKDAALTLHESAPHGITDTHEQQLGDDLLAFLRSHA